MISRQYVETMSAYNAWMNVRLYESCARLSDIDRKRDVGAFFKSLHGTLNHLLVGDRVWMARFKGLPSLIKALDQELYSDFEELREQRVGTDREIISWAASLSDTSIGSDLSYMSIVNPQPRTIPLRFALVHFFNHQAHHRGQVTTLLMQLGIDPGVTDLLGMPELQPR